jgi:hypothetical protein
MAKVARVKHILTIGTAKYSLRANDIYADLGTVTGVTKAPASDNTNYTDKIKAHHFAEGIVIRLKARGVTLNTDGTVKQSRDFTIITTPDKEKSALAGLDAKTIKIDAVTWNLTGARVPQRRRFS